MNVFLAFAFFCIAPVFAILVVEFPFVFLVMSIVVFFTSNNVGSLGIWKVQILEKFFLRGAVEALLLNFVLIIILMRYYNDFKFFLTNRSFAYSQMIEISKFNRDARAVFDVLLAEKYGVVLQNRAPKDKMLEHFILMFNDASLFSKVKNQLGKEERELLSIYFAREQIETLVDEGRLTDALDLVDSRIKTSTKYAENSFITVILAIVKVRVLLLMKEFKKARATALYAKQVSVQLENHIDALIVCCESFHSEQYSKMLGIAGKYMFTEPLKQALADDKLDLESTKFVAEFAIKNDIYSLFLACINKTGQDVWNLVQTIDQLASSSILQKLMKLRCCYHFKLGFQGALEETIKTCESVRIKRLLGILRFKPSSELINIFDAEVIDIFKKWECISCNLVSEHEQAFCFKCAKFNPRLLKMVSFGYKESAFDSMSAMFSLM